MSCFIAADVSEDKIKFDILDLLFLDSNKCEMISIWICRTGYISVRTSWNGCFQDSTWKHLQQVEIKWYIMEYCGDSYRLGLLSSNVVLWIVLNVQNSCQPFEVYLIWETKPICIQECRSSSGTDSIKYMQRPGHCGWSKTTSI